MNHLNTAVEKRRTLTGKIIIPKKQIHKIVNALQMRRGEIAAKPAR